MATYENCYEILEHVRRGINEYSSGFLQGSDTTCPHSNSYLVKKINAAQRFLYSLLFRRIKEEFLESASLTGVNSVYTLPWDFGIVRYFKDENGYQVFPTPISNLKLTNATGYDRLYYQKGRTFVLDKSGVTDTYTLFYYRKPLDLDQGSAAAGAATSITLASSAKAIADYYNGVAIEINSGTTFIDTITDYTAARVATITNTGVVSTFYGTVSNIPEPFHFLIAPKAVQLVKAESPLAQEKPTQSEVTEWNAMLLDALRAFAGTKLDKEPEDLFLDWGPRYPAGIGIVNT